GPQQERLGDREAERFSRGEIDDEIELGRLLNWDIGWFHPAQYLVDIPGSSPVQVRKVWSIRHQTCRFRVLPIRENCRQSQPQRQGVDANPVGGLERVATDIDCVRPTLDRLEGRRDVLASSDW